ncbi:hypothetical protein [Syntrophomonas wolfei]|uniref:hypothetical protein n=1 Tax=Syntrophomonas wolfei TaxID=863 RepID=UPI0023F55C39|nr:hypothetical protein [Syntrophomonas wolfei]
MANERILRLLQCIQNDSDPQQKMGLVDRLVRQSIKYVEVVTEHSYQLQACGILNRVYHSDSDLAEIDNRRSKIHDSLITLITAVNRLCEHYGIEPLYGGGHQRREMGDFALELVKAYFQIRV